MLMSTLLKCIKTWIALKLGNNANSMQLYNARGGWGMKDLQMLLRQAHRLISVCMPIYIIIQDALLL